MANPIELQQAVMDAATVCAGAATGAIGLALQYGNEKDFTQAGALAATAAQAATAANQLCAALMALQAGPVKAASGTPPGVYGP